MRLKLVLKIVEGTVLPCNYMYELSSCLYKVLNEGNPVFTAWLHDKGYCKEKKAFKLFTFQNRGGSDFCFGGYGPVDCVVLSDRSN